VVLAAQSDKRLHWFDFSDVMLGLMSTLALLTLLALLAVVVEHYAVFLDYFYGN